MLPGRDEPPLIGRDRDLLAVQAAIRRPRAGALIVGAPGVGKTRLAQEVVTAARAEGRHVLTTRPSPAGTRLPLAALAGLLPPPGNTPPPVGLVEYGLHALRDLARPADVVLLVDDVHLLDDVSAAVIHQLVAERTVTLLATLRTGEPVPEPVTALWKDLNVLRVDLDVLDPRDVDLLVGALLGGPVEGRTSHRLREAAAGNPLFLRELLISVGETGRLERTDGVWRLTGPLGPTPRLVELLADRLAVSDSLARDGLELLAFGEPVPLSVAAALVCEVVLEKLERRGLIAVTTAGRRRLVRLSHPLYGELLRADLPELARLRYSRRLADALDDLGARRGEDIMRVALWRLDGGGPARPERMLAAAERAMLIREYALAERLAGSAYDNGAGIEAGLTLVRAVLALGRVDDALRWCAVLAGQAVDDADRARVAIQHASTLGHHGDDLRAGEAVLDAAPVSDPHWREQLDVARFYLRAYGLDCSGLDAALTIFHTASAVETRIVAASAAGAAMMLAGRYAEVEELVARTLPLAVGHTGSSRVHTDGMRPAGGWMRCNLLDVAGAWAQTEAAYQASLHPPDRVSQTFSAFTLGMIGLMLGQPETASRWAREAYLVAEQVGSSAVCRWAAAVRLQAAAQRGAGQDVTAAAADLTRHRGGPHRVLLFEMEVARAWAWRAAGRADAAGVRVALGAEITRHGELGAVGAGAWGALDLVRLGEPELAARLLARFPPPRDWVLGQLIVRYATAAAAGDAAALLTIARTFAGHGFPLHAAEAAARAAAFWRTGGEPQLAARALLLADLHLARCEPTVTPALRRDDASARLTDRERDIALAAAAGESARAIAQRLYVAERTVENHLHRAYRKLAVAGRAELRDVLGLD